MKPRQRVYVIGAGGHARVTAEIVQQQGHTLVGFLDDNTALYGHMLMGVPIVGAIARCKEVDCDGLVIAIGHNQTRQRIKQQFDMLDTDIWLTVIHLSAVMSPSASMGKGSMIIAGSILNAQSRVGNHCIINTRAAVDHDCQIGDYAHLAPGVTLGGGVIVKEGALIGLGASVIPGCIIGEWAVVGAGACVTESVPPHVTVVGVPAKPLSKG